MEIEVGEYVRNKEGYIDIVEKVIEPDEYMSEIYYCCKSIMASSYKSEIVKHSKNIIDLIEVKDVIEINTEKYEVIYDKSYGKLGILIPNKEQLAIRHCSLEYIFSKQRN